MKVLLVNTLKVPHPNNKNKDMVLRGGQVHDVPDEIAKRALELGSAKEVDSDVEEGAKAEDVEVGEPPERPSNAATKEAWQNYVSELEEFFDADADVPDDAKRDDLIRIGDEFRAKQES